jgi:hypothetical protein
LSSRHVEQGAGAEYADPLDGFCDHCSKTVYKLYRYPLSGNRNYLCTECVERESGAPICSYCDRPTKGDYRPVTRLGTVTIACGICLDKWTAEYDAAVPA